MLADDWTSNLTVARREANNLSEYEADTEKQIYQEMGVLRKKQR